MAEIKRGFVCRRDDSEELIGHYGTWTGFDDREVCARYCRPKDAEQILPCVTYIGHDAPDWRERPTCPGLYIESRSNSVYRITQDQVDIWESLVSSRPLGPWFGPIPPLPEIPKELQR